jgi:alanine dehydrogenase
MILGVPKELKDHESRVGIAQGVNAFRGALTCKPVADSQQRDWKPVAELV